MSGFGEFAVPPADQQIVRVDRGEVLHLLHIALGEEEIQQPVIVEIGKLGMPAGGRFQVGAFIRPVCRRATVIGDVFIDRAFFVSVAVEHLQFGIAHRGQRIFGIAVAFEVTLRNAHAPDGEMLPAVGARIEPRRAVGFDLPELLLAAAIVVTVIGDPECWLAGAVPVGEQHRKGAEAR